MSEEIDDDGPAVTAPTPKSPPATPAEDLDAMSEDELREHLRKTRKSLKQANTEAQAGREARRRNAELEAEQEQRKQSEMSEQERLTKRTAELERKAREAEERAEKLQADLINTRRDREIEAEATRLGVTYPKQASAMLRGDPNNGIDYDPDTERFNGIREAVKKLVNDYDNLTRPSGMPVGRGTPQRGGHTPPKSPVDASQDDIDAQALRERIRYASF